MIPMIPFKPDPKPISTPFNFVDKRIYYCALMLASVKSSKKFKTISDTHRLETKFYRNDRVECRLSEFVLHVILDALVELILKSARHIRGKFCCREVYEEL